MNKIHDAIALRVAGRTVYVSQCDAVRMLGVHPKTAQRWANGQQRISRERALLLAILSGQVVPWSGWDGFSVKHKRGPSPTRRPFAVLVGPDGREWLASDFYPVRVR